MTYKMCQWCVCVHYVMCMFGIGEGDGEVFICSCLPGSGGSGDDYTLRGSLHNKPCVLVAIRAPEQ